MDDSKLHIIAVTGYLKKDGKYLIVKRSPNEIAYPGKWTVPGGKVERGESLKETLKKEFLEETGIVISDNIQFLSDGEFTRPDGYHVVLVKFLCEYESGEVEIDENDFTDYAWVGIAELSKYDLIDGLKKEFELAERVRKN